MNAVPFRRYYRSIPDSPVITRVRPSSYALSVKRAPVCSRAPTVFDNNRPSPASGMFPPDCPKAAALLFLSVRARIFAFRDPRLFPIAAVFVPLCAGRVLTIAASRAYTSRDTRARSPANPYTPVLTLLFSPNGSIGMNTL
ncbi:MAG: hypothetical protein LBC19_01710 [Tannerella sp.]|jgi:hypothetical protein|nr:hypothetical protein [Tannerella sp.]